MAGGDEVIRNFEEWEDEINQDLLETLERIAAEMETAMRQNRPWQDRTGLARNALVAYVDAINPGHAQAVANALNVTEGHGVVVLDTEADEEGQISIILTGLMSYNEWLEVGHAGQHAVILPTLEAMAPGAKAELERLVERLG
jgi:hypothetical protein